MGAPGAIGAAKPFAGPAISIRLGKGPAAGHKCTGRQGEGGKKKETGHILRDTAQTPKTFKKSRSCWRWGALTPPCCDGEEGSLKKTKQALLGRGKEKLNGHIHSLASKQRVFSLCDWGVTSRQLVARKAPTELAFGPGRAGQGRGRADDGSGQRGQGASRPGEASCLRTKPPKECRGARGIITGAAGRCLLKSLGSW